MRRFRTRLPNWAEDFNDRIIELERQMADITQAETDLAAAVGAVATRVQTDIATLKAEIAATDNPSPALQAAADAIEAQVAGLAAIDPANPPAPAPPTEDTAAATPAPPAATPSADGAPAADVPPADGSAG